MEEVVRMLKTILTDMAVELTCAADLLDEVVETAVRKGRLEAIGEMMSEPTRPEGTD